MVPYSGGTTKRNTGYIHVQTLLKEKKNKRKEGRKEGEYVTEHGCHKDFTISEMHEQ